MPSLRSRLSAAWLAFQEPQIVDAGLDMEQEAFETGLMVGRAAAERDALDAAIARHPFWGKVRSGPVGIKQPYGITS